MCQEVNRVIRDWGYFFFVFCFKFAFLKLNDIMHFQVFFSYYFILMHGLGVNIVFV